MKIAIHPLFLAVGVLSAVFGGLPMFIICALTALLHECGHIFYAEKLGFDCTKVSLMPYGASAVCNIEGISPADEVRLALAGPFVNFALCVFIAGLWWFVPQTYAYTDLLFYASAGMLAVNLLPAYPLDGGRVAKCLLIKFLPPKKAEIAIRVVNLCVVAGLITLFFTVYKNFTLLTLAGLLMCSALQKSPPAPKINFAAKKKKRGREIRYIVLDKDATYKQALRFVDGSRYLVLQIYGDEFLDEITEDELFTKLQTHGIYDKIYTG